MIIIEGAVPITQLASHVRQSSEQVDAETGTAVAS